MRRPANNWKQVNINFIVCLPSAKCATITFILLTIITTALTVALLSLSSSIEQHKICSFPSNITVSSRMENPIYVYLKFSDYYQNYRQYANSLSLPQLRGDSADDLHTVCHPVTKLDDLSYDEEIYNYKNTKLLKKSTEANPCGLIAASFINYTVNIGKEGYWYHIHSGDIEWESYESSKFENSGDDEYIDKENKRFVVWMRTAATKDFLKFYGKIEDDLHGDLWVDLKKGANFLGTKGKPCVLISTANRLGGKNQVLGWTMMACALGSFLWVVVFCFISRNERDVSIDKVFSQL